MPSNSSLIIVIPCFNEEKRFPLNEIKSFFEQERELNMEVLFVNDGSQDGTINILQELKSNYPLVSILDIKENVGKAEAIRQGMLSISNKDFEYFGYLDADLATPIEEILNLLHYSNSKYKMIIGSRIKLLGFTLIKRSKRRHYLGRIFATFASMALSIPIYDTQCGAKLLRKEIVPHIFQDRFISKWLFDIEIIFRLKALMEDKKPEEYILEMPLKKWTDIGGSKVKILSFLIAPYQLLRIYLKYK